MPTSISTLISQNLSTVQGKAAGLLAFREYASSFRDKLIRWSSGLNTSERLSLPLPIDESTSVIGSITYEQYDQCISEAVDNLAVVITSTGETMTFTAEQVRDAVQNQADQLALQTEFIDYNLSTTSTNGAEFATNMLAKYRNLSADAVDSITAFFQDGDPGSTLQGFLSTISSFAASIQHTQSQNEYIQVVSPLDYTGVSVWSVVWNNFTDKVASFFKVSWEGITKLGEFIGALVAGVVNTVKWLVSTAIAPLTTRFDKTSAPIGIADIPVLQCKPALGLKMMHGQPYDGYGEYDYVWLGLNDNFRACVAALANNQSYLTFLGYKDMARSFTDVNDCRALCQILARGCFEQIDGIWYTRTYDVLIPGDTNCDFIARVGVGEDNFLCVQLFPMFSQQSIKTLHDGGIFLLIVNAFKQMMYNIASSVPFLLPGTSAAMQQEITSFVASVFPGYTTITGDEDNLDFAAYLPFIDPDYLDQNYTLWRFIGLGLLRFIARYAPSLNLFPNNPNDVCGGLVEFHQSYYIFLASFLATNWYTGTYNPDAPAVWDTLTPVVWNDDYLLNRFPPFLQRKPAPVTMHYQTTADWASEISHYILAAVIAAAAIFATVKFIKFKKQRRYAAQVAQGYADNMSWTMGQNPTPEQMQAYVKARKKSNRMNRLNSALGISSPTDSTEGLTSAIDSVFKGVMALQGVNEDGTQTKTATTVTLADDLKLITQRLGHK